MIVSEDLLQKLADLAPPETDKAPAKNKPAGQTSSLGPVDPEKYLNHYGILFNTITRGSRTLYRFNQCLFDPAHGKNHAYIQQDANGVLAYCCSHESCRNNPGVNWNAAKQKISGDDSLAPFCAGYDPNWTPKGKRGRKGKKTEDEVDQEKVAPAAQPQNEDERSYLTVNPSSGRVSFVVAKFRDFLLAKLAPLVNEGREFGGLFYRYDPKGVWVQMPEAAIRNMADEELGNYSDPRRISNAVSLLADRTYVPPEKWLPDPMWINLRNCMLHLPTMETAPHEPRFNSRVQLPITYNPQATCPRWQSSLMEIFVDEPQKIKTIQQFFGYCLYPKIIFPCAIFQIGPGGNGKGTVQRVLETMLGEENVCHISLQRMEDKWGPIELKDKLLNACGETAAKALEVTQFKAIAAADMIQAEVKFGKDVKYRPVAKHLISMNAFPGVKDTTDAFFRRLIVMEYKQKFEGEGEEKNLGDRLIKEELDGIFIWAIEGLRRVLETQEIMMPEAVVQAKKRFKAKVNNVVMFVGEGCDLGPDCKVSPPALYRQYLSWCDEANIDQKRRRGKQNFYEVILTEFKVTRIRPKDSSVELFAGIELKPPEMG